MTIKTRENGNKKDKESTIFSAACRVIRDKGFHQARMADIAREAGISYGLVYHYYKSKNDLFDALFGEWWAGLDGMMDRLGEADLPVRKKLEAVAGYFLDQYEDRTDLVHLFITEFSRASANLTPARLQRFKDFMARTADIISRGQTDGAIRCDLRARYLSYFFLGSVEALLSTMVLENQPLPSRRSKERMIGALMTMFFEGANPLK